MNFDTLVGSFDKTSIVGFGINRYFQVEGGLVSRCALTLQAARDVACELQDLGPVEVQISWVVYEKNGYAPPRIEETPVETLSYHGPLAR